MKNRQQVALDLIDDNPWQPRNATALQHLEDLADNIHQLGLLEVPLARPTDGGRFQSACGHRRIAACRLLRQRGLWSDHIDMDVEEVTKERMALIALAENAQRQQLTNIEVVRAYKRAIAETNLTVDELAENLDMKRPTLANHLRVLELPDFVLQHVESGDLSLSVAREFLVLQHGSHVHFKDMEDVVRIIARVSGRRGIPDWTRRHVRERIYLAVAYNEKEWRPLGPKPGHTVGGANREAGFDIEAFKAKHRDKLHTIPAVSKTETVLYEQRITCDNSRLWTCEVREWSRRQTRATREASKAAEATTQLRDGRTKGKADSDSQLGKLLAQDPVWKKIAAARQEQGPCRPVTDQELALLGSRAELHHVSYDTPFWKYLRHGNPNNPYAWERLDGGLLPPWFPDLEECHNCVIGAAYAKSKRSRPLSEPTLVCLNKKHYLEKMQEGEARYRDNLARMKTGLDLKDERLTVEIMEQLEAVPGHILSALATSLLVADPTLQWHHPLGSYHHAFSFEPGVATRVRELLHLSGVPDHRVQGPQIGIDVKTLESVVPSDLPELVATLTVQRLRQAGMIDNLPKSTIDAAE